MLLHHPWGIPNRYPILNTLSDKASQLVPILTVKSQILDHLHSGPSKGLSACLCRGWLSKIGRICPSTNRQYHFKMPVFLLEEEKLLDTSIYIVPLVIPRVAWVMLRGVMARYMQLALWKNTHFVCISPCICQIASSRVRPNSHIQI